VYFLWAGFCGLGTLRVDFMRTLLSYQKFPMLGRARGSNSVCETNGLITALSVYHRLPYLSIGVYPYVVFLHTLVFLLFLLYNRHIATRKT